MVSMSNAKKTNPSVDFDKLSQGLLVNTADNEIGEFLASIITENGLIIELEKQTIGILFY